MKKSLLLVLATAFISGISIFLNKFALAKINPFLFTTCKNFIVMLFLFSILFLKKEFPKFKSFSKNTWLKLILVGFIGGGIPFLLFFYGLKLTIASKAAFIHKTLFLWVSAMAFIFLKERLTKKQIISVLFLLVGAFLLISPSFLEINVGDLLILLATLFWSVEQILAKSVLKMEEISGTIVAFCRMFFGLFIMIPFVVLTNNFTPIFSFGINEVIWILFTSVLLLGYVFTWYNGIKKIEVSKATAILLLGSVITTMLNAIYAFKIQPIALIASMIIILSLYIFSFKDIQIIPSKNFFSSK